MKVLSNGVLAGFTPAPHTGRRPYRRAWGMPTLVFCALATACGSEATARPVASVAKTQAIGGFWDVWGDGAAELDHYTLTTPRYGELRTGTALLVFVTEDFTAGQVVKSDGGHGDEFPVWKLNDVRHFQTGIYDYEVMTSTFLRVDGKAPLGQVVKVSNSVQEWCGHAYAQLVPRGEVLDWTLHSYFDGEADQQRELALPEGGIFVDALPQLVRGWVGALVEPGGERTFRAMPTLLHDRFAHVEPAWTDIVIRSAPAASTVTVPAGTFDVREISAELSGVTTTWSVETTSPWRIVAWRRTDGEHAELVASQRLPYWSMHSQADEAALGGLGLAPSPR
jgi:hypothetical protein